jgi:hypothetical protein
MGGYMSVGQKRLGLAEKRLGFGMVARLVSGHPLVA